MPYCTVGWIKNERMVIEPSERAEMATVALEKIRSRRGCTYRCCPNVRRSISPTWENGRDSAASWIRHDGLTIG